jgi:hypothetical protein
MNEIMRNCVEWIVSLGWAGLLLFAIPVVGAGGLVMA